MKYALACIKMVCVGVIVLVLLFSFSRDVFADNCIYAEHGSTESWPEDTCHSYECGSPSGLCSSGFKHYSCDYYEFLGGAWGCYWQAYNCQSACGGDGGGGGHTPIWDGWHDGNFGEQASATCRASGWVTDHYYDPQDRDQVIRIYADGDLENPIYLGGASNYRSDLEGHCTGGTCAFDVDLNGRISPGVEHNILIFAGNFMLPAMDYTVSPPVERNWTQRKITCAATPPVNTAPTGTLTCPGSPMYLGNSASGSFGVLIAIIQV